MDLDFRPQTYFRPQKLEQYLLSCVKGAVLRQRLQALFDAGRHAEVSDLLHDGGLSARDRRTLEAIHPRFMGGNYLPDTEDGEVEIARIVIQSTTCDVTCVYAKPVAGSIFYRVVDEYGGDTLQGRSETTTREPMTLGEFADFFLRAWPLVDLVESNYENDVEAALRFFSASSDFYPDFDALCRERVRSRYAAQEDEDEDAAGDRCPFCHLMNETASGDCCEHVIGWWWDGQFEVLEPASEFQLAFDALSAFHDELEPVSSDWRAIAAAARGDGFRSTLVNAIQAQCGLADLLQSVDGVRAGEGWATGGMLGGSGSNLYVQDAEVLQAWTEACHALANVVRSR